MIYPVTMKMEIIKSIERMGGLMLGIIRCIVGEIMNVAEVANVTEIHNRMEIFLKK